MATLYRAIRIDYDGRPLLAPTARGLGVRPDIDIPVDDAGMVEPGTGGMSVAEGSLEHLPAHRRPPAHGGTGLDPVWRIEEDDLGEGLTYRLEEPPPAHGMVEPAWGMHLEEFELALAETRDLWTECS
jgi:hypothetical protein